MDCGLGRKRWGRRCGLARAVREPKRSRRPRQGRLGTGGRRRKKRWRRRGNRCGLGDAQTAARPLGSLRGRRDCPRAPQPLSQATACLPRSPGKAPAAAPPAPTGQRQPCCRRGPFPPTPRVPPQAAAKQDQGCSAHRPHYARGLAPRPAAARAQGRERGEEERARGLSSPSPKQGDKPSAQLVRKPGQSPPRRPGQPSPLLAALAPHLHAHRPVEQTLRRHLALRVWRRAPAEEEPQDGGEAATAGAAGAAMAAARPGPAGGSPGPGRCAYFVERKKRFCKMVPAAGRRFCGEHGQQEVPGLSGRNSRRPSPDGKMGSWRPGAPGARGGAGAGGREGSPGRIPGAWAGSSA